MVQASLQRSVWVIGRLTTSAAARLASVSIASHPSGVRQTFFAKRVPVCCSRLQTNRFSSFFSSAWEGVTIAIATPAAATKITCFGKVELLDDTPDFLLFRHSLIKAPAFANSFPPVQFIMDSTRFSFGKHFDRDGLARAYRDTGRIEITDFIAPEQALALRRHLLEREDWALVVNGGDQVYDIPREIAANFTADQRREFEAGLSASARAGFQFCYESIRVPDPPGEREKRGTLLDHFVAFMASPDVSALFNAILGTDDIVFADGQATAYGPGHFLTRHDDDVAGKNRVAAYVLGLAPDWRAEWGGLLMFHRADGNIAEAFTPMMGTLRLFRVPTPHSVSYVTPFAPEPRLSVTGWLRTRPPDHSTP